MRLTIVAMLAAFVGCAPAAAPPPTSSPTPPPAASAPAGPAPSASAVPTEAPATAADLWADCNLLRAVAWRLEAHELAGNFANDGKSARTILEQESSWYSALTPHHPDGIRLRAEYQGHFASAALQIEQVYREMESAAADAVPAIQLRLLALRSSEVPDGAAARVCPAERPAGEPSQRVLCAELAAAGYEGLRWALFDNQERLSPLRTRIESAAPAAKLESLAQKFGQHAEALAAAHRRYAAAAKSGSPANADERNALMPAALADVQRYLRASCGGDMP